MKRVDALVRLKLQGTLWFFWRFLTTHLFLGDDVDDSGKPAGVRAVALNQADTAELDQLPARTCHLDVAHCDSCLSATVALAGGS